MEDLESKQLLKHVLELTEENNRILHKVRGVQRRGAVWRALKYLVIVTVALGSFYFLEPYINQVKNAYNSIMSVQEKIDGNPLKDLFK